MRREGQAKGLSLSLEPEALQNQRLQSVQRKVHVCVRDLSHWFTLIRISNQLVSPKWQDGQDTANRIHEPTPSPYCCYSHTCIQQLVDLSALAQIILVARIRQIVAVRERAQPSTVDGASALLASISLEGNLLEFAPGIRNELFQSAFLSSSN